MKNHGHSLIELIVAIGLLALLLPALVLALLFSREGRPQQQQRQEALLLLKETLEIARSVRESDWTTFAVNGTYHPAISSNAWTLLNGPETVNDFTRQLIISDVYRNSSGVIVASGGTIDLSTKKITTTVSWNTPFASSVSSTYYVTRHENLVYAETTEADFNAGTRTNVAVTNTAGGEVVLGGGGSGNWCDPNLTISAIDLPKNGVANAVSAIEGSVFAGTGDNASGVSYANVAITNTKPPTGSISGTFDGYKTNDVFGETQYAYLATDTNSKEIVIIDLNQLIAGKYQEVGFFNAPGNDSGKSVYVSGNTGYVIVSNRLYNFDLASKSGSRPILDTNGVELEGTARKVVVVGNYAYIATSSLDAELQIVDISNPTNLVVVGQADTNSQAAQSVFVNQTGTRAYLGTSESPTQNEFFIIDISTKTGNRSPVGSYNSNGMSAKGVTVVTNNKAILVGTGGQEYQVIDITNEANPTPCGGLQIDSGVNGMSAVIEADGDAYSYIITGDASGELKIIEGGPGGSAAISGTFESQTFDAGKESAFNSFDVTVNEPSQTDITFQIGIADAIAGSCNGVAFSFVGPDQTSGTFFTDDSVIPFHNDGAGFENPAQCLRYKAYLSTNDVSQTPILYDFRINYSP